MINRYQINEMAKIWDDQHKFSCYLKVEKAALEAYYELNPSANIQHLPKLLNNAKINPERIKEIEEETKHDLIAFCTSITEQFVKDNPEMSKWFHFGLTSSDIIDTATMLQIKDSLTLCMIEFKKLLKTLHQRATEFQNTPCMGRSHGMYAEPLSFGQKILGHYCEFSRVYECYHQVINNNLVGQISGAVGNYTVITPDIEKLVLSKLKLKTEAVSTQVVARDHFNAIIQAGVGFANAMERLCVELRHLQRSEVAEVHEGRSQKQKGSSTMPHKKNPISSENLTGMARILRSHGQLSNENCILWHERDISHSSVERMMLPDHFGILLYSLRRLNSMMENLVIHTEKMEKRAYESIEVYSSYLLHLLLQHTSYGRDKLYPLIQKIYFEYKPTNLEELKESTQKVLQDENIESSKIPWNNLNQFIFLKHVEHIFQRVNKQYPLPSV